MSRDPSPNDSTPEERAEWRESAITFVPAVAVAFGLNFILESQFGWTSRRSLLTSIGLGIALALLIQLYLKQASKSRS